MNATQQVTREDKYSRFQSFKVLAHAEKIHSILNGQIPSPVEWVIYPSNICGYQCGHCIMAKEQEEHKGLLSMEAMRRIPEDAVSNKIKCVIFSGGGDPLLNKYTNETAHELKKRGVSVGLNNQGYLLDDPTPYNFIRFSVDAASREIYKQIHGIDGWERVSKNIKNVADRRRTGEKIELGLAFLITPLNWFETVQFCDWAQQFDPDFIHIRPAFLASDYLDKEYPGGDKILKENVVPNLKAIAKDLESKYANVFFRVDKFEGYWTPKKYTKCRATPLIAVTSGDGAFLICQDRGIRREENYLRWGNYNKQTFDEIWWSQDHYKILDSIDLDKCPRCVENGYNEIIEHGFIKDGMKLDLL